MGSDYFLNPPPPPPLDQQVRALMDNNRALTERVKKLTGDNNKLRDQHDRDTDRLAEMVRQQKGTGGPNI